MRTMKTPEQTAITTLTVKDTRSGPVRGRHPWVFSGALKEIPEGLLPGTPVRLAAEDGRYLGSGYFNSYSQIAVRVWGYNDKEIVDREFFVRRIRHAAQLRKIILSDTSHTDACRMINAEGDMLPGLVVDKYDHWLTVQFHNKGIESWRDLIVEALVEVLSPEGIYERSESPSRKREGAGQSTGLLWGSVPELITIKENGISFYVDIPGGQKTGFFLDQRDKRLAVMGYAGDQRVLNCFSYTGGFSVYALAGGARQVVSVEVSAKAVELARRNVELNGMDAGRCEFVDSDAKQYLRDLRRDQFDMIILDPPAFIKDRRKKNQGMAGYKGINESAIRALQPGGMLMTCSCSAHLSALEFRHLISECGRTTGRTMQLVASFGHGPDHPVLLPYTEGEYLKCLLLRMLD